jgi:hypothetical protein
MSQVIKHIQAEIGKNRNYCVAAVGRVGTGKTYSAIRLATQLQPGFTIDNILFDIPTLLDKVYKEEVKAGEVLIFDEAGISASNRESYMNKFNKAMSFLLQTWRHRQIILIITTPNIAYIDAGTRKMFDAIMECKKVVKSRKVVQVSWKFLQTNTQSGKTYYHNAKTNDMENLQLEVGKPGIKILRKYEKKKKEFTDKLYKDLKGTLIETKELDDKREIRRCPECKSMLTRFNVTEEKMNCRQCGHKWLREVKQA